MNQSPTNSLHRVIRASAGTGKTYQLSSRYLWLLARGARPGEILATTFTRKAAGEIFGRIIWRLAKAAQSDAKAKHLGRDLGLEKSLNQQQARNMLSELCGSIGRLSVSTIDAFFHRVVQSFRHELGLPFQAQLVDENDALAQQLHQEALEAVLADEDPQKLVDLLRRLQRQKIKRSVSPAIDRIVQQLYEVYRQAPREDIWSALKAPDALVRIAEASELIETFRQMGDRLPTTRAGHPNQTWARAFKRLDQTLARQDWLGVLEDTLVVNLSIGEYARCRYPEEWRDILESLADYAEAKVVMNLREQARAMFELLRRFDGHFRQLKHRHRVMLFSDLSQVLADQVTLMDQRQEELFYRLDRRIRHLLLDEFQDTSLEQWKVLEPLAQRIVQDGGEQTFFCVGDAKQSIYGWRGGCSELFARVQENLHLGPESVQSLHRSFRSSPVVLEVVNRVFDRLADYPPLRDHQATVHRWLSHFQEHQAVHENLPGYVELQNSAEDEEGNSENTNQSFAEDEQTEAEWIAGFDPHLGFVARRVEELTNMAPGRSLGVLVRRNSTVRKLIFALRRLGVASSGEGGNPLTDDPAVNGVLAAIRLADHPGDTVAGFHVLHSPLGAVVGLTTPNRKAFSRISAQIRQSLLTHGYAAVIGNWARALAGSCSERSVARLMQLVELADRYEPNVSLRPGDFLRYVQSTEVEEPLSAAVRVMTVHKAKGLEFDIVVLAELDQPMGKVQNSGVYVVRPSPTEPIRAVYAACPESIRGRRPELAEAFSQEQARRLIDDLSALYVGMTRARHALHMIVRPLRQKKSGEPQKRGWDDLSPAAVLRFALTNHQPDFEPDTVLFACGDAAWAGRPAVEPVPTAQAAEPLVIQLAPPEPGRQSWSQINPSAMENGGWVNPTDLLAIEEHAGRQTGTLVHTLLAQVRWVDEPGGVPSEAQLRIAIQKAWTDSPSAAQQVNIQAFRELLAKPGIRQLLSKPCASKGQEIELWRERRFAVQVEERLLVGQFDRVVIERSNGRVVRAHLIDFKTDQISDEPDHLNTLVERYRPQIQAYRSALTKMLNLEETAIRATLVFIGLDQVIDIPPQVPQKSISPTSPLAEM